MSDNRWLIAGLGNPGAEYAGNRHNCGFMVADVLAARIGARFKRDRSRAVVATGRLAGHPVTLAAEPEALVLHVLAAPTAEQIEAELGEVPAAEEEATVPESVPGAEAATPDEPAG